MSLLVDIQKDFGKFRLNVSFTAENEVMGLLGASGCGKSMTLKCIAGIVTPDRGKIVADGEVLFDSEKKINKKACGWKETLHIICFSNGISLFLYITYHKN